MNTYEYTANIVVTAESQSEADMWACLIIASAKSQIRSAGHARDAGIELLDACEVSPA